MYTVAELIETLKQCPQEYEVMVSELESIEEIGINHENKTVDIFTDCSI